MKKIFIFVLIIFSFLLVGCESSGPLDEIEKYTITVNPNDDGTLNMTYYLRWKVLQEGDGGVDFITVGVANRFVEDIEGLTDNIKKIRYYSDEGSTIKIDFTRTYHEGDVFEVKFKFRQERIFTLSNNQVQYSFNPGWFDEIRVKKLVVLWNNSDVLYSNANEVTSNQLRWETSLDFGETIDVNVTYDKSSFPNLDPNKDYSGQTENPWAIVIFIGIVICFFMLIYILSRIDEDKYQFNRGFSGRISRVHFRVGRRRGYRRSGKEIKPPKVVNSGGAGGGGGHSCACACACAGGGRAGCSRKDFNNYLEI